MKKALIVTNLRGFVSFLWNDIRILQELGYKVHYASNSNVIPDTGCLAELASKGVLFHQIDFSSKNPFSKDNFRAYKQIKAVINNEGFDLIHCHTPIAGFITRLAAVKARKYGTKVIYTTHGFSFTHLSSKKEWAKYYPIEKIASYFTDVIITINREDYETAKRLSCKDVRYINGVGVDTKVYHDTDIDRNTYREKLGIPINKTMILSVGELSARKNHQVIIKALGLLENTDQYVYVICGREVANSGFADHLKKLADENDVELILLGHRGDIAEIMHCSDIGAIPSVREGLGLAGIESLSAGVPLVGTDVQGISDYIIPEETGYLCNPYDIRAFSEAIKKLSSPTINHMLSENCYRIAQKFDISVSGKQMSEIYKSVLASN